jgi:hypothetical protein
MSAADGAIPKSAPQPHNDLPRVGRTTTNSPSISGTIHLINRNFSERDNCLTRLKTASELMFFIKNARSPYF